MSLRLVWGGRSTNKARTTKKCNNLKALNPCGICQVVRSFCLAIANISADGWIAATLDRTEMGDTFQNCKSEFFSCRFLPHLFLCADLIACWDVVIYSSGWTGWHLPLVRSAADGLIFFCPVGMDWWQGDSKSMFAGMTLRFYWFSPNVFCDKCLCVFLWWLCCWSKWFGVLKWEELIFFMFRFLFYCQNTITKDMNCQSENYISKKILEDVFWK